MILGRTDGTETKEGERNKMNEDKNEGYDQDDIVIPGWIVRAVRKTPATMLGVLANFFSGQMQILGMTSGFLRTISTYTDWEYIEQDIKHAFELLRTEMEMANKRKKTMQTTGRNNPAQETTKNREVKKWRSGKAKPTDEDLEDEDSEKALDFDAIWEEIPNDDDKSEE